VRNRFIGQIAYDLGVAVSSVSTMLWRARQRVGLGGRGSIVLSWLAMAGGSYVVG